MTDTQAIRIIELLESIDKKLSSGTVIAPYTMGAKEAAKYVSIGYDKFLQMIRKGENIPHSFAGKKLLFRSDSLDQWQKNKEKLNTAEDEYEAEPPVYGRMRKIKIDKGHSL